MDRASDSHEERKMAYPAAGKCESRNRGDRALSGTE